MSNYYFYKGRAYKPVLKSGSAAIADNPNIAQEGDRLMFRHDRTQEESCLFIAPQFQMCSGFVIGVFL
jgi:hypothetical protein